MTVERPVDAVQWHEGMLLAPQHFQQAARRGDELAAYHAAAASPWHWGVIRLRLDEALLSGAGVVRVLEAEAILPDGLVIHHDAAAGDEELQLDLAPFRAALESGPLTVFLAVPVALRGPGAGEARYRSIDGPPTVDDNTGEDAVTIPRLRPRLRLVAGTLPPARLAGLPILRVRLEDETIGAGRFQPPCLLLPPRSELAETLSRLAARLREKAVFLAERTRSPALPAGEPLAQDLHATIARLVSALPPLEALLASGGATPFAAYLALAALVGQLAGLGGGQVPPLPPAYRHDDLWSCFQPLLDFAERRLSGIQMQYREVPFSREPGTFFLLLKAAWRRPRLIIGVRRGPGQDEAAATAWISRSMIASLNQIPSLSERRLLGARRHAVERDDELGVVPTERVSLFAIEADPGLIQTDVPLVIVNRLDMDMENAPADLLLYVPLDTGDAP